jgi:hypothetical protein
LPLFFFSISNYLFNRGAVVAVIVLDLQLPMQSVSITTKVVSWNPVHGEVSSIHWTLCDKVCQWFTTGRWFSPWTPVSSINKTAHHDITAILMKVALNTINLPYPLIYHKSALPYPLIYHKSALPYPLIYDFDYPFVFFKLFLLRTNYIIMLFVCVQLHVFK